MPELPEVETTVRYLRERLLGDVIVGAQVRWARSIDRPKARKFCRAVKGMNITAVERRGKFIVISLSQVQQSFAYLLGHLRMSGSMDVIDGGSPLSKHDRVILRFGSGKELRFNDPRKFGRFYLVHDMLEVVGKLGPEPFDRALGPRRFHSELTKKRCRLKPLLLNQEFLAGVGNIYADECLWRSQLHPNRLSCSLRFDEAKLLLRELRRVLKEAIRANGTDAGDGVVENGTYEPRVYGRTGEACHRCGELIRRIVVGQRGTHYCPSCQKLRRTIKAQRNHE